MYLPVPEDAIKAITEVVREAHAKGELRLKTGVLPRDADIVTRRDREMPFSEHSYRFWRLRDQLLEHLSAIQEAVAKSFKGYNLSLSGLHYYPAGSYMGWHTNSDTPALRVYITWGSGDRGMRFVIDGKVVTVPETSPEPTAVMFNCTPPPSPLWHSVYSEGERFSIGYRLYPEES